MLGLCRGRRYGPLMQTDKRYQVFVSSTYLDLKEARQAVVSTLLGVDAFPAGMELFPATDDDAWTLIEDVIRDSDYYLLIIGGKYGSVDEDLDISYTEREYDTAVAMKKPVMAFLHGEPGKLLAEQSEDSDARRKKLAKFRSKVEGAKHVKYWSSPEELAGRVALTWNTFTRRYPATGWIKADRASSRQSLEALAKAQDEIASLRTQLEESRTMAPPGTERLAQGAGTFVLPIRLNVKWRYSGTYQWNDLIQPGQVELSWDRVFGYFGLSMMHEESASKLHTDLTALVRADYGTELEKSAQAAVEVEVSDFDPEEDSWVLDGVGIRREDFQTIMLQLNALGLVRQSERNRSVKDRGTYWTLTPYGRTRLVQIRAIPAGESTLLREGTIPGSADAGDSDSEG